MAAMNVYEKIPTVSNERFVLRDIDDLSDLDDLFAVYSDERAVPFFNSDNCHGDSFFYPTKRAMAKAIQFWRLSYEQRYFIRWVIVDRLSNEVVGTIELFHREAEDAFDQCALLRLDLRSDYEEESTIIGLLDLIEPNIRAWFSSDCIATKAIPQATERISALQKAGFALSENSLIGHDGTAYSFYYVKKC